VKLTHQLTELSCEKATADVGRRELPDGNGLYLVVHPSGAKTWAVRYRQGGRSRKLTIPGAYPAIGLKAARRLAKEAVETVAAGGDPGADKIASRKLTPTRDNTFELLAALFLDRWLTKAQQRPRPRTIEENARLLGLVREDSSWTPKKGGLAARWKGRPVPGISRADVVDVLDELIAAGVTVKANHTRGVLHLFFGWCMRRGVIEANPVSVIDKPAPQVSRSRVLTDQELGLFWKAADEDEVFGPLYKLLALTGQRRDEARGASWDEFDLDKALWSLPGNRTKNGKAHAVPLSAQVITLLQKLPKVGRKPRLLFTTNGDTMVSGLSRAKERLDARMLELAREVDPDAKIARWVLHDLRRTCATGMQKLGIALPVIEKILNHSSGSFAGIVGVYQLHDFAHEKRAALDAWARHVEDITWGKTGHVVKLRAAG